MNPDHPVIREFYKRQDRSFPLTETTFTVRCSETQGVPGDCRGRTWDLAVELSEAEADRLLEALQPLGRRLLLHHYIQEAGQSGMACGSYSERFPGFGACGVTDAVGRSVRAAVRDPDSMVYLLDCWPRPDSKGEPNGPTTE